MKKYLFVLALCACLTGLSGEAKEVFAPLQLPSEDVSEVVEPVNNETQDATLQPVHNVPLPGFGGIPYFGGMRPVVETRTLQGGTLLERRDIKQIQGKVAFIGGDVAVIVKPVYKISTANPLLKVGDYLDFVVVEDVFHNEKLVLNKNTKIKGMVLKLEDNDYHGKSAEITIGQFEIPGSSGENVALKGTVNKKGETHEKVINYASYLIGPAVFWIRGSELKLLPEKEQYTLYIGDYAKIEEL